MIFGVFDKMKQGNAMNVTPRFNYMECFIAYR